MYKKKFIDYDNSNEDDEYDKMFASDLLGLPYMPANRGSSGVSYSSRDDNPVVFLEISTCGGRKLKKGNFSQPQILGRLHFELRADVVPVAAANFLALVSGQKGVGEDGVNYHYKGLRIHRIVKDLLFQSGDLLDSKGDCSRSIYNNGGLFLDENFILRNTGSGCISYCNRGPDTNGSLFQVSFIQNFDLDGHYVVFGCLASKESYETLFKINSYGTESGEPTEEIRIYDCGIAYQK